MQGELVGDFFWGHNLEQYREMFDLSEQDLSLSFLNCGAAPGSFCAEMTSMGKKVIAISDVYDRSPQELRQQFARVLDNLMRHVRDYRERFVWDKITSVAKLKQQRTQAMEQFLADLPRGLEEGRYIPMEVGDLSFKSGEFDLAICSHTLFTLPEYNSETKCLTFIKSIGEIAKELRIFPLLDELGEITPLLGPVMQSLQSQQYGVEVREVDYHFQKGGNAMLRVWANSCAVVR